MADAFQASNILVREGYGLPGDNVINIVKGVKWDDPIREATTRVGNTIEIVLLKKFFRGFSESATDFKNAVKETMAADCRALGGSLYPERGPNSGGECLTKLGRPCIYEGFSICTPFQTIVGIKFNVS